VEQACVGDVDVHQQDRARAYAAAYFDVDPVMSAAQRMANVIDGLSAAAP
jgi:hypothetical protein